MTYEATAGTGRTITAFFDSKADADQALERLVSSGIPREYISLIPGSQPDQAKDPDDDAQGFWETLKDIFLPDEDRHAYAEGLRRGGYLISVTADEENYDTALDLLDDEGTIDIAERETTWRSEGWKGYESADFSTASDLVDAESSEDAAIGNAATCGTEEVIPVAEEHLRIGKRDVSNGRVRVRSYIVETPVTEEVSLREENVKVDRRAVDRPIDGEGVFQDRTIEVEERAEEAVVAKDARIKEELVVSKEVGQRSETVSDTVRHTEVEVDDERDRQQRSKRTARR
jgi:uncharacterized protein (TIGR02271 family)